MSDPESIQEDLAAIRDGVVERREDLRDVVVISWPIATSHYTEWRQGRKTIFNSLRPKTCTQQALYTVNGVSRTGQNGTVKLSLNDYHCAGDGAYYELPVILLATARTSSFAVMTAVPKLSSNARDVELAFASFDPDGRPLPNVSFSWSCVVPAEYQIE